MCETKMQKELYETNEIKLRNMTSVYLSCGDKLLLLYRIGSKVINDSYTGTAGGHFEKEELNSPKACMLRELYEETGLKENNIKNVRLRYVTLRLKNNEIRQNYYYFADVDDEIELESNEGKLKWVRFDEAVSLEMPYTSKYIVKHYLEIGRYTDCLYSGAAVENDVIFTELNEFPDVRKKAI